MRRVIVLFVMALTFTFGAELKAQAMDKKEAKIKGKIDKKNEKEIAKAEKEAIKRHLSVQTKEVRKRMKKNLRKANRKNRGLKPMYHERIGGHKPGKVERKSDK